MAQEGAGEGCPKIHPGRERAEDNVIVWIVHPGRGKAVCWGAGWMGVTHRCGLSVCLEAYAANLILSIGSSCSLEVEPLEVTGLVGCQETVGGFVVKSKLPLTCLLTQQCM